MITNRIGEVKLYSKLEWKHCLKDNISIMVEDDLRNDSLSYKKIDFQGDSFGSKHYIGDMRSKTESVNFWIFAFFAILHSDLPNFLQKCKN